MPQISAQLNYLRISPRKVRAVAQLLKGLDVDLAEAQLKYLVRKPSKPFLKLLNSAASNAKNNLGLDKSYLYIKEIIVNEGAKLKRYKPKGFGLPMPIQRKTSHIRIVLDEISEEKKKKKEAILAKMPRIKNVPVEKKSEEKPKELKTEHKPKTEKEIEKGSKKGSFGGIRNLGRKLFRRKSI